jgi:hypothetical protein
LSSHTRQCGPVYKVQCRVTLDSAVRFTTSNVESHSTVQSGLQGPMSSHTRQYGPVYKVQCRVTLDSAVRFTRFNVESHSTLQFGLQGPMSSSHRHHVLKCFVLVFRKFCHLVAAPVSLKIREILWKINLEKSIEFFCFFFSLTSSTYSLQVLTVIVAPCRTLTHHTG